MRLATGHQLMKQCNLACFEDVQRNTLGLGGLSATFVGYPTEEGVGSMFAQVGNAMAISSSCPEKAAAWAFVRQFFLPDYQQQLAGSVFPTNLSVYEAMKQTARSTAYQRNPDGSFALDAEGRRIEADRGSATIAGVSVPLRTVTEEEIALVEEIVAATTHVLSVDESLKEILVSNAAPYFIDQRSVEETVRQIQSRATIYVNEQR
jgi:ABC-type glycerol-3-phosphate transport system substrate-binding protein